MFNSTPTKNSDSFFIKKNENLIDYIYNNI